MVCFLFLFFFSSRRRHTRWPRDWSSDVCSSDLAEEVVRAVIDELDGVDVRALVPNLRGAERAFGAGVKKLKTMLSATDRSEERRVGKECKTQRWREHKRKREKNNVRKTVEDV